MHEEILLTKFLRTKPQVKSMNINFYVGYYTVIKNLTEGGGNWDLI